MKKDKTKIQEKKDKLLIFFGALVLITALAFVGGSSMYTLIGQSVMEESMDKLLEDGGKTVKFASGKVYACSPEILRIEHSIDFIPTGTEYYYVIMDIENRNCMVAKAPKNWDLDYFQDLYNKEGIEASGQVKEMDHDVKKAFATFIERRQMADYNYSSVYYIDLMAKKKAIIGLTGFILDIVTAGIIVFIIKQKGTNRRNARLGIAALITAVAGLILTIKWFEV
ncbi:MAG: hypothetical protein IKO30_05050 [Lachnospiraceae bacterium]|nr:hypothetical protein [Lachnospiraceae bacterium]